jgi:hypothetical protein
MSMRFWLGPVRRLTIQVGRPKRRGRRSAGKVPVERRVMPHIVKGALCGYEA